MKISSLDKVLSANGYDFDFVNGIFHVKLGGFANKVSVSWDFSHQRLNYSYRQTITHAFQFFGLRLRWIVLLMGIRLVQYRRQF
ncbi:hypothetical protein [Vibrio sp. EA2]|uniref:hypothetical protein n=1 Tax=Vibrio sp. EA2 TaxID=3079860 RepID=UPI00294A93EB|nr:hypothetical protein [Vibrio sp. EA2]MDV6254324.1 hypothetical protein [Vibrio sp. EA2]